MKVPVKRIVFVLHNPLQNNAELVARLEATFGVVEYKGADFAFDQTDYYAPEMGEGLARSVWCFAGLVDASQVVDDKLATIALEKEFLINQGRAFNLDVGYLDSDKVVLPSLKKGPYKIYANRGVWLDLVMNYAKGVFNGAANTFVDFQSNPYQKDLMRIREYYKRDLKQLAKQ